MCTRGKTFGVHVSYFKIRRAVAPEWFTIKQSEMFYKGEEHSDNEHAQEAPLDLWHPILISPTGAPEPHITLTVGNKLIDFLIDTTFLCKLNTQIFSPEQLDIRVPLGPF